NNIYQFADYLAEQKLDSLRDEYIKRVFAESMQANIALYDKLINDIAMRFNKEVNPIKFSGQDVFIIPENYRGMLGAFAHIFRNIVDHAIEYPDDRKDKNKTSAGNISIETGFYKDDSGNEHISIKIKDDGNGIDANFVRERLKSNNPSVDWAKMSDFEILQQIFSSGFSTKTQVTEDSGRGVGMDVVRNEILKLGGDIIVNSQVGVGTEFSIHVPYMLKLNALK
ncbi:MAG: ATP-binding protein, partial [Pseudomonadota bacterium]